MGLIKSVVQPVAQSVLQRIDGVTGVNYTEQAYSAFSVRDIGVGPSGYVMEVIRDSDLATLDITAAQITDGTLSTFVGTGASNNGYVRTWYDQTGNGRHMTGNSSVVRLPHIVKAGVVLAGLSSDEATSNTTMQYLRMSQGTSALASEYGGTTKAAMLWVGSMGDNPTPTSTSVLVGALRGVGSYQNGGLGITIVQGGNDSLSFFNERDGSADSLDGVSTGASVNDTEIGEDLAVVSGTVDDDTYSIKVNNTFEKVLTDTENDTVELDGTIGMGIMGSFTKTGGSYYQRSTSQICREVYFFGGDNAEKTNIDGLHSKLLTDYSI